MLCYSCCRDTDNAPEFATLWLCPPGDLPTFHLLRDNYPFLVTPHRVIYPPGCCRRGSLYVWRTLRLCCTHSATVVYICKCMSSYTQLENHCNNLCYNELLDFFNFLQLLLFYTAYDFPLGTTERFNRIWLDTRLVLKPTDSRLPVQNINSCVIWHLTGAR